MRICRAGCLDGDGETIGGDVNCFLKLIIQSSWLYMNDVGGGGATSVLENC